MKDPLAALQSLKWMGPNYAAKPIVPSRVGSASSVFRGVSSQGARWRTRICIQKQEYTVGDFDTEENAALAYDQEAIRHNKLKNLNFLYKGINDNLLGVQQVAMQSRGLQIDARSAEVMAQALREHEDSSASSALGTAQPVSTGSEEYSGSSAFADYSYGSSTSESPYGGSSAATGSTQPHVFGGGKPASLSATGVIDYSSSCGSSLDHSNASGYPRGFVNANDVATAAAAALQASAAGAGTFLRSITHPSESARSGEAEFDVLTTARAEPSGAPVTASPTDDYCRLCHHVSIVRTHCVSPNAASRVARAYTNVRGAVYSRHHLLFACMCEYKLAQTITSRASELRHRLHLFRPFGAIYILNCAGWGTAVLRFVRLRLPLELSGHVQAAGWKLELF